MAAPTKSSVSARAARLVIRLALIAVVGLIFAAATIVTVLPRATHGAALTVLTGSMTPHLPVGSVVLIRPVDPGTLHVGDVATYQKSPGKAEYVTHRIVGINASTTPTTFTFKGDANRGPDIDPVPATAIRGKVWFSVPYLGTIRDAVHTKGVLFSLAIIALIGYALVQLASALRERRHPKSGPRHRSVAADSPMAAKDQRQVMVMTFRAGQSDRLAPEQVALALGGVVLGRDADSFSVVVVKTAERAPMTPAMLATFEPLRTQRFELVDDSFAEPTNPSTPQIVDLEARQRVSVTEVATNCNE